MEQPGLEVAPIWEASIVGDISTHYATVLAPDLCLFWGVRGRLGMNGERNYELWRGRENTTD